MRNFVILIQPVKKKKKKKKNQNHYYYKVFFEKCLCQLTKK